MSKSKSKSSPKQATARAPAQSGSPDHDDELIVPKGVSRGTFLFLIGLIVFLMIIWIAPGALYNLGSGSDDSNPVALRIELPGQGTVEWNQSNLMIQKRTLKDALDMDVFLAMQLGIDLRRPEDTAFERLLALDTIALDAGIEITDDDLRAHLQSTFDFQRMTPEDFRAGVRARGLDQKNIEGGIRALLRVARFQQIVAFAGAVPDPQAIEEQWKDENVEFAFDYVAVPAADLNSDARAQLPDDAALQAWFDELGEADKQEFRTQEKRAAELVLFRDLETTPATELLASYPEQAPEGVEPTGPEELAEQYYNLAFTRRFAKPAPEEGDSEEGDSDEGDSQGEDLTVIAGFFTFDEVHEACLAEAPIYFAMQRWAEDLGARKTNGEAIDLAAEAQRLGLAHQTFPDPLTRAEFSGEAGFGDGNVAAIVFSTPPDGSFHPLPVPVSQGVVVVRTNALTAPELPAFESVRDQVADKWVEPKARELALERLNALREGFESFEPPQDEDDDAATPTPADDGDHFRVSEDVFQTTVQSFGFEANRRDYLNKAGPASDDPQSENEAHRSLFALARSMGLYELEPDEVAKPGTSIDGSTFYLVRLAGQREVPMENMSPVQYDRYKRTSRQRAMAEIGQGLDIDFLRENYSLWMETDDLPKDEAAEG